MDSGAIMVHMLLTRVSDSITVQLKAKAVFSQGSGFGPLLGCRDRLLAELYRRHAWYRQGCRAAPARPGG